MKTELLKLLERSGKRAVVTYEGQDRRKSFDESAAQKKMDIITSFIGNRSHEIAKKLAK